MTTLETRNQVLDLIVDIEENYKNFFKVNITLKNKKENNYINNALRNLIESLMLNEINKNDFLSDLSIIRKNVENKFN
jgi:succinate dehydrogenase/fumarate reductase-like Fe-S protein